MFINFDASRREKPLSTFHRTTHKYISFSCRVNLLLFFVLPLHPSTVCCAPKSSSFSTCSSFSLSSSSELTALFSSSELTDSFSSSPQIRFHHHPQILDLLRSVRGLLVVLVHAHHQPLILELLWSPHCVVLHSMLVCHCFPSAFHCPCSPK